MVRQPWVADFTPEKGVSSPFFPASFLEFPASLLFWLSLFHTFKNKFYESVDSLHLENRFKKQSFLGLTSDFNSAPLS